MLRIRKEYMKKAIVLNKTDVTLIQDICDYLVSDDREAQDFYEQARDMDIMLDEGLEAANTGEWLNSIPKELHSHIYYKVSLLNFNLVMETHS
jgi:hypothetical protein